MNICYVRYPNQQITLTEIPIPSSVPAGTELIIGNETYISDRFHWVLQTDEVTVHTADTVPDPSTLSIGDEIVVPSTGATLKSRGSAFIGVIYRDNTPVSSANSIAANFQTPIASFTIPAGAMDKDSTMIIDMLLRVFDTVSASRVVRVFANTQQIAAYAFTSTSGLIPMQFRMVNCGDAGAQLQCPGLTVNGTESTTVNSRQIDTQGMPTEITITTETLSGQLIKQALFVELK